MTPDLDALLRGVADEWLRHHLKCTLNDPCAYDHTCDVHKELARRIFPAMAAAVREAVTPIRGDRCEHFWIRGEKGNECPSCLERDALRAEVRKARAQIADLVNQFACPGTVRNVPVRTTGGLSDLESAFTFLGLPDPCPESEWQTRLTTALQPPPGEETP